MKTKILTYIVGLIVTLTVIVGCGTGCTTVDLKNINAFEREKANFVTVNLDFNLTVKSLMALDKAGYISVRDVPELKTAYIASSEYLRVWSQSIVDRENLRKAYQSKVDAGIEVEQPNLKPDKLYNDLIQKSLAMLINILKSTEETKAVHELNDIEKAGD